MKQLLILLFITSTAYGQKATLSKDAATYQDISYKVGDTVHLGYGSNSNKNFAFIQIGSVMTGVADLDKAWAKADAVINKIYKTQGTIFLRAKLIDKTVNAMGGNRLFINLEGAIDNKELR